jgi:hypothetical protein
MMMIMMMMMQAFFGICCQRVGKVVSGLNSCVALPADLVRSFISAEEEEEQQQQPLLLQEFQEIDSAQQQERGVVVKEIRDNGIRGRRSISSFSSSSSRWSRRKFDRIQHYRLQEVSWRS